MCLEDPGLEEGVGSSLGRGLHEVQDLPHHILGQGGQHVVELDLLVRDVPQPKPALDVREPRPRASGPEGGQFNIPRRLQGRDLLVRQGNVEGIRHYSLRRGHH